MDGRNASYAPEPTQDVGSENGNTRAGGYAGESFLCAGFAMCEAIAANHNRNQACHLRNGSGDPLLLKRKWTLGKHSSAK